MPIEAVDEPLCVRTYLRYFKYNKEIDFAKFGDNDYDFKELNNIKVPLLIRWGTINEIIVQSPQEVVKIVNKKVKNDSLNIGYIEGANHSFYQKEEIVINQILEAVK